MLEKKYEKLKKVLEKYSSVVIGFSGGVDSTLLAKVAHDVLGDKAVCVTLNEAFHANYEIEESKALALKIGIRQYIFTEDVVEKDFIKTNPKDRCYYCKKTVFAKIDAVRQELNMRYIIDGTNADDLNDYRPGLRALDELGVKSPLYEAGFTKKDVRELSRQLKLPTWSKPAFACLASRVPYNDEITVEKLEMVERAEVILMQKGFRQFRVRHHGTIARIEVDRDERKKLFDEKVLDDISTDIKKIGFKHVAIEASGYTMGSLNNN